MSTPCSPRFLESYTKLKASRSRAALHASSSAAVPIAGCPLDHAKDQHRHASFLFKYVDKISTSSEIVIDSPYWVAKETIAQGGQVSTSAHTVVGHTESVSSDAHGTGSPVGGPTKSVAAETQGTSLVRNGVPSVFGSEQFGCDFGFQVVSEGASLASGATNNYSLDETGFDEFVFCFVADDDTTVVRPSFVEELPSRGELSQAFSSAGRVVATVVGSAASAAGHATNKILNVVLPKRVWEDAPTAESVVTELPSEQLSTAAQPLDEALAQVMPHQLTIRNTFIDIAYTEDEKEKSRICLSLSAPSILMSKEFHTKYPAMEKAHIRGECRPCAYFYCKGDGCRLGGACRFCHLCPSGAFKKQKKVKIKALRQQKWRANQDKKILACPSPRKMQLNIN